MRSNPQVYAYNQLLQFFNITAFPLEGGYAPQTLSNVAQNAIPDCNGTQISQIPENERHLLDTVRTMVSQIDVTSTASGVQSYFAQCLNNVLEAFVKNNPITPSRVSTATQALSSTATAATSAIVSSASAIVSPTPTHGNATDPTVQPSPLVGSSPNGMIEGVVSTAIALLLIAMLVGFIYNCRKKCSRTNALAEDRSQLVPQRFYTDLNDEDAMAARTTEQRKGKSVKEKAVTLDAEVLVPDVGMETRGARFKSKAKQTAEDTLGFVVSHLPSRQHEAIEMEPLVTRSRLESDPIDVPVSVGSAHSTPTSVGSYTPRYRSTGYTQSIEDFIAQSQLELETGEQVSTQSVMKKTDTIELTTIPETPKKESKHTLSLSGIFSKKKSEKSHNDDGMRTFNPMFRASL